MLIPFSFFFVFSPSHQHRWFLTDDQDQMLGASFPQLNETGPMPQTKALMAEMGATANNFYIHTPICKLVLFMYAKLCLFGSPSCIGKPRIKDDGAVVLNNTAPPVCFI